MRKVAGGCEAYNAECKGSGVSVEALSSYSLTNADTRSCALLCLAAKASASNSCLRELIEVSGDSRKVNTGSASMNRIRAIASLLASVSGVNLLNSGAITVGYSTSISSWNPLQTNQAYSHHNWPDFSISIRMTQISGKPMTAPIAAVLTMSAKNSPGVILLKPNRVSSTNCL